MGTSIYVLQLIREHQNDPEIQHTTPLNQVCADSLDQADMAFHLEDKLGIHLSGEEISRASTVEDLVVICTRRKEAIP
jgi:acyl carrier protein